MDRLIAALCAGVIAVLTATSADAVPRRWDFDGANLNFSGTNFLTPPATITGRFFYDDTTGEFSNFRAVVTGSVQGTLNSAGQEVNFDGIYKTVQFTDPTTLIVARQGFGTQVGPSGEIIADGGSGNDGTQMLALVFGTELVSSLNRVGIGSIFNGTCDTANGAGDCNAVNSQGGLGLNFGFINPGFVQVIPVPAAAPLLLTGLIGLGFFARRRRAAA